MSVVFSGLCMVGALAPALGCLGETEARPRVLRPTTIELSEVSAPLSPVQAPDTYRLKEMTKTAVVKPLVSYPERDFDLSEVRWTVPRTMAVADLASQWGLSGKMLRKLNPDLRGRKRVREGDDLRVYAQEFAAPTRSLGAPNRGKLEGGVPLPEGDSWRLRQRRVRVYGNKVMVQSLMQAFEAYGAAFIGAPEVRLGDLSNRNGGRLAPHKSHRTGRDVDIGYVLLPGSRGDRYWQRADEQSFDVEKNWFLVKALIETGNVQQIFMSVRLQKLIMPLAERELSPEQMARYFRRANPDPRSPSVIKHWKGHLDHMHVRFRCEEGNTRCVSRSR
ncbi:MAG: penicillin-insensitive murein endopeptidase [Nannocystaceae bacterium]|nr:penicillin-insensitive murein endopeptidase [Nannocystaceae bacterium]